MQIRSGRELILRLFLALYLLWPLAVGAEPRLEHQVTLNWSHDAPWFGGWSGIEVGKDGRHLVAVSDKGTVLRADMVRQGGRLTGLAKLRAVALKGPKGRTLRGKRTDAEGLALGPGGRLLVSFEHAHRVMELDPDTGLTSKSRPLARGMKLQANSGFEALAIDPENTIFAIPERSGRLDLPFPLYAHQNGAWHIAAQVQRRGPFLPAGADFDSLGRLWILERAATPLGFRSRIRRFDPDPDGLIETTLLQTLPGRFDNLEGLSVWQSAAGRFHLTLISDDNFLPIQRTQIVEFILRE